MNTTRNASFNEKHDSIIDEIRKAKGVYGDALIREHLEEWWDLVRSPLAYDVDDKPTYLVTLADTLNEKDNY